MTKKELADRLIQQTDGNPLITVTVLMDIFKIGYRKASDIVNDLTPVTKGNGKRNRAKYYFVDDIAEAIMRKGM